MIAYAKGKLSTKRKFVPANKSAKQRLGLPTANGERHAKIKEEQPRFFGDAQLIKVNNLVVGFTKSKSKLGPTEDTEDHADARSTTTQRQKVVVTSFYKSKEQDFISGDPETSILTSQRLLPSAKPVEGVERPRLMIGSAKSQATDTTLSTHRVQFAHRQSFRVKSERLQSEKSDLAMSIPHPPVGQFRVEEFFQPSGLNVCNGFSARANESLHHMTYRAKANRSLVQSHHDIIPRSTGISINNSKLQASSVHSFHNKASFKLNVEERRLSGLRPVTARIDLASSSIFQISRPSKPTHPTATTIATETSQDHGKKTRCWSSSHVRKVASSSAKP